MNFVIFGENAPKTGLFSSITPQASLKITSMASHAAAYFLPSYLYLLLIGLFN